MKNTIKATDWPAISLRLPPAVMRKVGAAVKRVKRTSSGFVSRNTLLIDAITCGLKDAEKKHKEE